jgi:hypothetical protein
MALEPPAPRLGRRWRAEHGDRVALGVTVLGRLTLLLRQVLQHLFQPHDAGRLQIAGAAQRAAQQPVRQLLLCGTQFPELHARILPRHEPPPQPLAVVEGERRLLPLSFVERGKEALCSADHRRRVVAQTQPDAGPPEQQHGRQRQRGQGTAHRAGKRIRGGVPARQRPSAGTASWRISRGVTGNSRLRRIAARSSASAGL